MNNGIKNQNELDWVQEQTNGAPYELWLSAGGVYVVMARKLAALFAQGLKNIFEADRVFYRDAFC